MKDSRRRKTKSSVDDLYESYIAHLNRTDCSHDADGLRVERSRSEVWNRVKHLVKAQERKRRSMWTRFLSVVKFHFERLSYIFLGTCVAGAFFLYIFPFQQLEIQAQFQDVELDEISFSHVDDLFPDGEALEIILPDETEFFIKGTPSVSRP